MAYRLDSSLKPAQAARRVFRERIRHARRCLDAWPDTDPEGLHEARKDLKKLRALLRLLRRVLPKRERRALNARLRDTAAALGGARDREALLELAVEWRKRLERAENAELHDALERLRAHLEESGPAPAAGGPELDPETRREISLQMDGALAAFEALELRPRGWAGVRKGAKDGARRMREAAAAYRAKPSAATLHEWRKRTKDRLHHLTLLRGAGIGGKDELRRVKRLEVLLGLVRDCDLLLSTIRVRARTGLAIHEWRALKSFARAEKARLLGKAQSPPPSKREGSAKASTPARSHR